MDQLERIWVRRDGQSRDTGCTDQLQDIGRASDEADQCVHAYYCKHNIIYHHKHLTYYKLHSDQYNNTVAKQAIWLPTTCGESMLDSIIQYLAPSLFVSTDDTCFFMFVPTYIFCCVLTVSKPIAKD